MNYFNYDFELDDYGECIERKDGAVESKRWGPPSDF